MISKKKGPQGVLERVYGNQAENSNTVFDNEEIPVAWLVQMQPKRREPW